MDSAGTDGRTPGTPEPRETVFRARGLTKVYDMGEVKVHALRGADLDLFEGELIVLLGPSVAKEADGPFPSSIGKR